MALAIRQLIGSAFPASAGFAYLDRRGLCNNTKSGELHQLSFEMRHHPQFSGKSDWLFNA